MLHRLTGRFVTEGRRPVHDAPVRHPGWRLVGRRCSTPSASTGSRLPEIAPPGSVVGHPDRRPRPRRSDCRPGSRSWPAAWTRGPAPWAWATPARGVISESTGGALTVQASVDHHGGDPSRQTPVYVHSAPGPLPLLPGLPHRRHGADVVPGPPRRGRRWRRPLRDRPQRATTSSRSSRPPLPPGCDGLTMLPHLAGAFSPEYVPEARGVFAGLTLAPRPGPLGARRAGVGGLHAPAQPGAAGDARAPRPPRSGPTAAAPGARSGTR